MRETGRRVLHSSTCSTVEVLWLSGSTAGAVLWCDQTGMGWLVFFLFIGPVEPIFKAVVGKIRETKGI